IACVFIDDPTYLTTVCVFVIAGLARLLFTIQPFLQPCSCWLPSHLDISSYPTQLPAPSRLEVPITLALASGPFTLPPAPPWLLPPLAPSRTILLGPSGYSRFPPWSIVAPSLPWTSGPSAMLSPSNPMASLHSSFPQSPPLSPVSTSSPQTSGSLAPPPLLVMVDSPWSSILSESFCHFSSL
ncbi:hypothetical protein M9458_041818, partial [Cirrhinus mrigala]